MIGSKSMIGSSIAGTVFHFLDILEIEMNFIIWIVVGGIIGWLASLMMKTDAQQGLLLNVVVGIIGALLSGWIIAPCWEPEPSTKAISVWARCSHRFSAPCCCWRSSICFDAARCANWWRSRGCVAVPAMPGAIATG